MLKRRWILGGLAGLVLAVLALDRPAPPAPGADPLVGEAHALLAQAYDVSSGR